MLDKIIQFFSVLMGINPSALNRSVWEQVLQERMEKTCTTNENEYYSKFFSNPLETQLFFERIVVLETWFFRDSTGFDYLVKFAFNEWYPKKGKEKIMKLLSLPCSTGEEPYSMAISLVRGGFPTRMFEIEAIDVCRPAIAKAELGIYGKNSFRSKDICQLTHYFDTVPEGYKISSKISSLVKFKVLNAFDPSFQLSNIKYDVIFCRNLLIYLHPPAQGQLVNILAKALDPQGMIIVGSAETEILRRIGFIQAPNTKGCAFQAPVNKPIRYKESLIELPPLPLPIVEPKAVIEIKSDTLLDKAKILANEGQFEEAISTCLNSIQESGSDPERYFLLGVLMHATNKPKNAKEFFDKTLYLNPDHQEALLYKALLFEAEGNVEEGKRFRERASRLERSGSSNSNTAQK